MSTKTSPQLIGVEDAAAHLGITVRQLRALLANRTAPPSILVGRRRYFRTADIDAWISERFAEQERQR